MIVMSTATKFLAGAFITSVVLLVVERGRVTQLQRLLTPPRAIEWEGTSIQLPGDYRLVAWPGTGFPAFKVVREGMESAPRDEALYFSLDSKVVGSAMGRIVKSPEQCRALSKYCVAVYSEQMTSNNPFCRAAVLRNDNHAKDYILDVQYELDDSGAVMVYSGSPNGFVRFLPLVDMAFSQYAKKHEMTWESGKACVERVLEIATAVQEGSIDPRPLRRNTTDLLKEKM